MALEDDTSVADAKDLADLNEGFTGETTPVKPEKPTPVPDKPSPEETPRAEVIPRPKHRRITDDEYKRFSEAADEVAALKRQQSSAFGSIGNLQKHINELKAGSPRGGPIVIPKDAFAEMERDFPELAAINRTALEKALSGFTGTGSGSAEIDDTRLAGMLAKHVTTRELAELVDAYPDWCDIVGSVDISTQQPDPNHPFRKWLATKDATYQARIIATESPRVIERAIQRFQQEIKAARPAPSPAEARRLTMAGAVQPKGDGAAPAAGKTENEDFEAGYKAR